MDETATTTTTMKSTSIRPYRPADKDAATRCALSAFENDPWTRHIFRSPRDNKDYYETAGGLIFGSLVWMVAASFAMSEVLVDDSTGEIISAAGWEPAKPTLGIVLRGLATFAWLGLCHGWSICGEYMTLLSRLETRRAELAPADHHHHVQIIYTSPKYQSQGYGSQLLQVGIQRAENAGCACYVECSNPDNIAFYQKNGFRLLEECYPLENNKTGEKGPVGYLMLREMDGNNNALTHSSVSKQ